MFSQILVGITCLVLFKLILDLLKFWLWGSNNQKCNLEDFNDDDNDKSNFNEKNHEDSDLNSYSSLFLNDNNTNASNETYYPNRIAIPKKVFRIQIIDSVDWCDYNNAYIYHYTSIQSARQILKDRKIIAKVAKLQSYGKNVYFTKCDPNLNDYDLITNNYIYYSKKYLPNIQCAFALKINCLKLKRIPDKNGRDIWRHRDDIDLNSLDFRVIIRQPNYRYYLNI